MKYRNIKTGNVIEINSKLTGVDWEAVKDRPLKAPPAKKAVKKKDA